MKRSYILTVGVAALCLMVWGTAVPALSQGRGQGFRPCPYTPYLCPVTEVCKPMTITGKVSQVLTETLQDKMHPGMAIIVDSKGKGRVRVHLGPVWYLERQEFDLEVGQEVAVKGICLEEKGETRLIAAQVTVGDAVLLLRDTAGRPMWEAWRKR
jgi:hypothetical protein